MPGLRRAEALARLARESFDLLVIGGGINGAGIARDAALRGLSVALVERDDFAAGTSSRSSRLIHGGVRYLEHGYLHLVFEASRERRTLLAIAPHLVRPLAFTWPVYAGARIPRWKLGAGLFLYDLLAAFRNVGNHHRLDAAGVRAREPKVRREGLGGGASYWDASTHDARLTLENVLDAARHGAVVVNHAEVTGLVRAETRDSRGGARGAAVPPSTRSASAINHDGRVSGVQLHDLVGGRRLSVRATVVINATGPWHDEVRRFDEPGVPSGIRGTKGAHIAVERARLGNTNAVTVISVVDGRVMFVLPAGPHAIVGTTDTATDAHPDQVRASEADVAYLIASANGAFPEAKLTRADVISAWAGIRPLIASGNAGNPSSASREHAIEESASGVIAVTGGKLTTYRAMSVEVVDRAERSLGRRRTRSMTADRPLPGGAIDDLAALVERVSALVGARDVAEQLVQTYGSGWESVWRLGAERPELRERVVPGLAVVKAELVWGVREEMASTLADLLVRRTPLAFQLRDQGRAIARSVAELVAPELGWTAAGVSDAVATWERDAARLFGVDA